MTPPKPPRKNAPMKSTITSSYDGPQVAYEDPDASKPAVKEESQSDAKVKPVPRPRTKLQPKPQSVDTDNTADSVDSTSNTTNGESSPVSEYPADYERPRPVRPPPIPPSILMTLSKPTDANGGGNCYVNINSETLAEPPSLRTERAKTLPKARPERPPPPAIYYDRLSTMRLKAESCTDEGQESRRWSKSSLRQTSSSPAFSEEEVNLSETYDTTATDRPAVPPRLGRASLPRSASGGDFLSQQIRPPPPSFNPPPPPSEGTPSETIYSEIDYRPYLDVLPEDGLSMTRGRSTIGSGQIYPMGFYSSQQQMTENAEDINGMLRWLKRVLKSDSMAPSLYGLSIEEEIRSFDQRAMTVKKALRLYNLLMMKRNETLRDIITEFKCICDCLDKMQKMTKTMDIAGGTTGAVGGVTAVLGIALAPATLGVSLIATAVGAGMVASAGGISAHNAKANKKVVNKMTVEKLVYEYKSNVVDLEHCLDFILSGMNELRRHDIARLQRAGAPPHAVKMANLSQSVFRMNNGTKVSAAHSGGMASERLLQAFVKDIDQYFKDKDSLKLKKSCRSRFSGRVCLLAKNLQSELDHLNQMWEMFS
uniref:uncharacterized protein n=1 Tax=Semicossyphus pulcher TaxID=241346 RepID=UPI0037E91038